MLVLLTGTPASAEPVHQHLRLIAPAAPGGGWDQTARVMQQALQSAGIVHTSSVENIPGRRRHDRPRPIRQRGARQRRRGDAVGAHHARRDRHAPVAAHAARRHADRAAARRVRGDRRAGRIALPHARRSRRGLQAPRPSRSRGAADRPAAPIRSSPGSSPTRSASDPRRVNYIAFSGGGESLPAILGGQVSVGVNGLAELRAAHRRRHRPRARASRAPSACPSSTPRRCVSREWTSSSRTGARSWRPPGVSGADRQRSSGAVETMVRVRRRGGERSSATAGTIATSPATRSRGSRPARKRACEAILTQLGTGRRQRDADVGRYPLLCWPACATALSWSASGLLRDWRHRAAAARRASRATSAGWRALALVAVGIGRRPAAARARRVRASPPRRSSG